MRRICFVNRFYPPDTSATSQVLADLARSITDRFSVSVVTSRKCADNPKADLPAREQMDGVKVFRVWTTRLGRAALWRKAIDFLSFHVSVLWFLLRHVKRGDIVVLKSDPPLLQLLNTAAIRLKGGTVVNWLQDIYPEIAIRLGKFPAPDWLAARFGKWRDRTLNKATVNVVPSESMAQYLRLRGVRNLQVIPNWADGELIAPINTGDNPLVTEWGVSRKFVVMYSGNFGRVHEFSEIIEAVHLLRAETDIHFIFIGDGAGLEALKQAVGCSGAGNVSFKPFQPRDALHHSLGLADLHLVALKVGMEGLVAPSKLYGILAAGRPIAFIGETEGEIAGLIRQHEVGIAVAHGRGASLAGQIRQLAREPGRLHSLGARARLLFEREYARPLAIGRWKTVLGQVVGLT